MSKTAEISLTEPAATEGSSDGPATDSPGKPSPKSEANQKALSAMYDAMAPLSGKKGRKDSDDESDDKPKKKNEVVESETNRLPPFLRKTQRRQLNISRMISLFFVHVYSKHPSMFACGYL